MGDLLQNLFELIDVLHSLGGGKARGQLMYGVEYVS